MNDYKLHMSLLDGRFVAIGVAVQAKGLLYRLRPDKGGSRQKEEDYKLGALPGLQVRSGGEGGSATINEGEARWEGSGDYWLGRSALTDLGIVVPGEGVLMINDATINVSLQKHVVQTALVGHKGTIKEYITDGDYQVNISVGLVAVDGSGEIIDQYPERAVAQLREILKREEALEVSSAYLNLWGITHLVVTGFSARQMTHSNRQLIEITAVSDREYVIESNDY